MTILKTDHTEGSIPACAGKPGKNETVGVGFEVHPRVRGEAAGAVTATRDPVGPSPRARGSHLTGDDERER